MVCIMAIRAGRKVSDQRRAAASASFAPPPGKLCPGRPSLHLPVLPSLEQVRRTKTDLLAPKAWYDRRTVR
jgi:hypothetical protein